MNKRIISCGFMLLSLAASLGMVASARAGAEEEMIVEDSLTTLREIMQIPAKGIPSSLLRRAEGVAIIPGMMKGGFVVGVQHGRGVLVAKDKDGNWESPRFLTLTGGSLGLQAGVQSADVVLVFCTRRSVESALRGQFTVGVDASVSAGPVGRQASAGTDVQLVSEIYSYSRSRGIFLGAAVDGSKLRIDAPETQAYYADGKVPTEAAQLVKVMMRYAGVVNLDDLETIRTALALADATMKQSLDAQWQQWLALPAGVEQANGKPNLDALKTLQNRYAVIATDPKYAALATKEEFRTTRDLLMNYIGTYEEELQKTQPVETPPPGVTPLPPPPLAGE